jgi:MFS family permease
VADRSRALQGTGGGGLTVTAIAMIGDIIRCATAASTKAIGAVFGGTTVLGPLLGGFSPTTGRGSGLLRQRADRAGDHPAVDQTAVGAHLRRPVFDVLGIVFISLGPPG